MRSSNGCPGRLRTTERMVAVGTWALPETSTLTMLGAFLGSGASAGVLGSGAAVACGAAVASGAGEVGVRHDP